MSTGGTARGAIHLGRFDLSVDADLEKLVGWTGGRFFANTLRDLRPRADAQLHPQSRDHQRDRGAARCAALQRLFRAELLQRRAQHQGRPAGRRRRVLRQPDRRSLHQRHVRLAGHQGHQPSGRRPGAADRGARHSRQGRAVGQDHRVRRGVQRQPGAARRRRPAASRQSRPGVSRQRSALGHRAGPLGLRSSTSAAARWPAISRRAAGIIPANSTISASPRRACRSPIPAEPASRQSFTAISASSRSSSRRCTARRR